MDDWVFFSSLSTVFQSYQDDGRVNMKALYNEAPFRFGKNHASSGRPRDPKSGALTARPRGCSKTSHLEDYVNLILKHRLLLRETHYINKQGHYTAVKKAYYKSSILEFCVLTHLSIRWEFVHFTSYTWYLRMVSRDMTKPTKWLCAQRRLGSAWASAQSDQSLRCALSG